MDIISFNSSFNDQLISLIESVYSEYDYVLEPKGFDKDLFNINDYYYQNKGEFWLLIDENRLLKGSIGIKKDHDKAEMKRFYLSKELRGLGYADLMLKTVLMFCKSNNIKNLYLWSDSKFIRSHHFYLKRGFQNTGLRTIKDAVIPFQEYKYELNQIQ